MTTTWKVVSAFSALGVAVLLIQDLVVTLSSRSIVGGLVLPPVLGTLSSPASQSPVRIVGGSMTLRAKHWRQVSGYWVTRDNVGSAHGFDITLEKVKPETAGQPTGWQASWANITVPWEIDVYAANPDGADPASRGAPGQSGIALCTNSNAGVCQAPNDAQGSTVTLGGIAAGADNATPSLYPAARDAPKGFSEEGKRFHNAVGCNIGNGDLCEHIFRIVLKTGGASPASYSYQCPDGECRVDIDPAL